MTLDPKFNKLPKVTDFGKASAVFQQTHEEGFRTLTGQELVSEIKDYIEITGIELAPIASGALPTPDQGQIRTMEVVGVGPWTHSTLPGGSVSMTSIQKGKLFWDGTKWNLRNVIDFTVGAIELAPIAGGALPTITTTGQDYKMQISGGLTGATFIDPTLPDGQVVLTNKEIGLLYFDGGTRKWSLKNKQELPRTPTTTEYGDSEELAAAQKLVTDLKRDFDNKISVISNEEFLYAIVDANGALLWGKRRDGTTYDCDLSVYNYADSEILKLKLLIEGLNNNLLPKAAVKNEFGQSTTDPIAQKPITDFKKWIDDKLSIIANSEFIYAIVASDNTVIWGKRRDGTTYDCDNDIPQKIEILFNKPAISSLSVVTNPEFLYCLVDINGVPLWGKRVDGSTFDSDNAIISRLNSLESKVSFIDKTVSVVTNIEFAYAIVDSNNILLWGKRRDGSTFDLDSAISDDIKILKDRILAYDAKFSVEYNPEYIYGVTDINNRLIEYIKSNGDKVVKSLEAEKLKTDNIELGSNAQAQTIKILDDNKYLSNRTGDIAKNLYDYGFKSSTSDWSNSKFLRLPICEVPSMVNIIIPNLPTSKIDDFGGYIEFWDYDGNYFKKKIVLNSQGNSSMSYQKKNFSLDLDDGSKIQFGDWVIQDSFHLKAHYTDTLKSRNNVAYDIFEYLAKKRPYGNSRVWDYAAPSSTQINGVGKLNTDLNTGARGFPDGFPCALYHNGAFYGIYMFNLKKHRDNYKMNRGDINQIHLDGTIGAQSMFSGIIDWTQFEIRNPNPRLKQEGWVLLDIDGNPYDGDNPKELSNEGNSGLVKQAILRLAGSVNDIKSDKTKSKFESYFANLWMFMDYFLLANRIGNGDAFEKNWQWLTYDGGDKWTIAPYDWDSCLGVNHLGNTCVPVPATGGIEGVFYDTPAKLLYELYKPELNARYRELMISGLMPTDGIFSYYKKWSDWIGFDLYDKENVKWNDMPGYRNSNINRPWTLKSINITSTPINYNANTTYAPNSEVVYGLGNDRYIFINSAECQGIPPLSSFYSRYPNVLGFYDGLGRVNEWLKAREIRMNAIFNYS